MTPPPSIWVVLPFLMPSPALLPGIETTLALIVAIANRAGGLFAPWPRTSQPAAGGPLRHCNCSWSGSSPVPAPQWLVHRGGVAGPEKPPRGRHLSCWCFDYSVLPCGVKLRSLSANLISLLRALEVVVWPPSC